MPSRVVSVTEFKANCSKFLNEIGERGEIITITKRGRPFATVRSAGHKKWKSLEGAWAGHFSVPDEVLEADTSDLWEVVNPQPGAPD